MVKSGDLYTIRCGDIAWELDGKSGKLVSAGVKGKKIAISGPELLILQLDNITRLRVVAEKLQPGKTDAFEGLRDDALNEWVKNPKSNTAPLTQWTAKSVQAQERDGVVEVSIEGSYKEAEGRFVLRFTQDGGVESRYDFTVNDSLMPQTGPKVLNPRQLGLVFDLPKTCDQLAWRRKALWTYYPEDHIGRPEGRAKAFPGTPLAKDVLYREAPAWPWSQDTNPLGSADFRSTKAHIYEASLTGADGAGLRVVSDGTQHARVWVGDSSNHLLVSDVHCECKTAFAEAILPSPKYKPGDSVQGTVRLYFQGAAK